MEPGGRIGIRDDRSLVGGTAHRPCRRGDALPTGIGSTRPSLEVERVQDHGLVRARTGHDSDGPHATMSLGVGHSRLAIEAVTDPQNGRLLARCNRDRRRTGAGGAQSASDPEDDRNDQGRHTQHDGQRRGQEPRPVGPARSPTRGPASSSRRGARRPSGPGGSRRPPGCRSRIPRRPTDPVELRPCRSAVVEGSRRLWRRFRTRAWRVASRARGPASSPGLEARERPGVAQQLERRRDLRGAPGRLLPQLVGGSCIPVRMPATDQTTVGSTNLLEGCIAVDAQRLVWITHSLCPMWCRPGCDRAPYTTRLSPTR